MHGPALEEAMKKPQVIAWTCPKTCLPVPQQAALCLCILNLLRQSPQRMTPLQRETAHIVASAALTSSIHQLVVLLLLQQTVPLDQRRLSDISHACHRPRLFSNPQADPQQAPHTPAPLTMAALPSPPIHPLGDQQC